MQPLLEPGTSASSFAAACPPGDPTYAMRKRIADLAWRARQQQLIAGVVMIVMLCMVSPTFGGVEHSTALPPAYGSDPYLPVSVRGEDIRHWQFAEVMRDAQQQRTVDRQMWFAEHLKDVTPVESDMVRFLLAQMARNDGDPREVAAQLGAMQNHWQSHDETDANVMRNLIEFVRANDLDMPLRQADRIAYNATNRDKSFLRDSARPGVATVRWFAALLGLCTLASLAISLRTGRLAAELLERAKRLR